MAGASTPGDVGLGDGWVNPQNGHWPVVTNYFQGHGSEFLPKHTHPELTTEQLREIHPPRKFQRDLHDNNAVYES